MEEAPVNLPHTLFLIEQMIDNLPAKGSDGWMAAWENLKGWIHGFQFFVGFQLHGEFHSFCQAFDRLDFLAMQQMLRILQKRPELMAASGNIVFIKSQLLQALEAFRQAFPPTVLKMRWRGFLDSLRVAILLGSPIDEKWAALVLAYERFALDGNQSHGVIQAVEECIEALA